MKKKGDLSDFKCGIIVGARQAGLKISETADMWAKMACWCESRMLDWLNLLKNNSSLNNTSVQPRYAEEHLWMDNTLNLEADGLQQQKTKLDATSVS